MLAPNAPSSAMNPALSQSVSRLESLTQSSPEQILGCLAVSSSDGNTAGVKRLSSKPSTNVAAKYNTLICWVIRKAQKLEKINREKTFRRRN